ncbi:hypothetical protein TWF694_002611 [Orbilia ellipsospora]|uniref:Uncharacterized protein n=1 Tax=Orbilia ellipsospora TaxID=2528407 RepID=A0AAV9X8L2_9PEZI
MFPPVTSSNQKSQNSISKDKRSSFNRDSTNPQDASKQDSELEQFNLQEHERGMGSEQEGQTENIFQLPTLNPPKGGGAMRSLGETFSVNEAAGTMSVTIPIPVTKLNRYGTPAITLSYSSANGNGPFGLGWQLQGIPTISRKTRPRLPTYTDDDVFILDGQELVPVGGDIIQKDGWNIKNYRPRLEGGFMRIQQWNKNEDAHWKVTSGANITSIFGVDSQSRIADGKLIFAWLLRETYDAYGGAQLLEWHCEDSKVVDLTRVSEAQRTERDRNRQRYLHKIKYGNRIPNRGKDWNIIAPREHSTDWFYELIFDYGELNGIWPVRQDPFSTYTSGFEIRTYRLCRKVQMFHNIPETQGRGIVSQLELEYEESPSMTILKRATLVGFLDSFEQRTQPLEFEYSQRPSNSALAKTKLQALDETSFGNIVGMLSSSQNYWVSLAGDGLPGLLAIDDGAWYYKRLGVRKSEPVLGDMRKIKQQPSLMPTTAPFSRLTSTARPDYAIAIGDTKGFFKNIVSDSEEWDDFKPFARAPNIDINSSRIHLTDVTGNGLPDIISLTSQVLEWYKAEREEGFNQSSKTYFGDRDSPIHAPDDGSTLLAFSDMTGDGLEDILQINNNCIAYWPNLGYGRFGQKVVMDNCPTFDIPDKFSADRIVLGDIEGSGTTDILYLDSLGHLKIWFNEAGNSWTKCTRLKACNPPYDSRGKFQLLDLLGSGTPCLVWSSVNDPSGCRIKSFLYADLMDGSKPSLLTRIKNNSGKETSISYRTSTSYYLQDETEEIPWITKLPFPMQCVDEIIQYDLISAATSSAKYRYHHGYYDQNEGEFRGYACVEKWDTATFTAALDSLPPIHMKTWYHTGAFEHADILKSKLKKEYFFDRANRLENDDIIESLGAFSAKENREACSALQGSILRSEVYTDDNTSLASLPYKVDSYSYYIRKIQGRDESNNQPAIFQKYLRESVSAVYDRNINDPAISVNLVEIDKFGNTLATATRRNGRKESPLEDKDGEAQKRSFTIFTTNEYTNRIDDTENFLNSQNCRTTVYEVNGETLSSFPNFECELLEFSAIPDYSKPFKRILSKSEVVFRKNDLTDMLKVGKLESLACPGQTYTLCYTTAILEKYFKNSQNLLQPEDLPSAGYVKRDNSWWIPSSKIFYTPSNDQKELEYAQQTFFIPKRTTDPFKNEAIVEYDRYWLFPTKTINAAGNTMASDPDYRTGYPKMLTDCNENKVYFLYDALGNLVGSALYGKGEGDTVESFTSQLQPADIAEFFRNPLQSKLLSRATTRYVYDYNSFKANGSSSPNWSCTITARSHNGSSDREKLISFAYFDGFGRTIQSKIRVSEDRWRSTGWTVYNEKNQPVKQFEPFFCKDHKFVSDQRVGVSETTIYDAVGRPYAVISPDGSWTKTDFGPWHKTLWDKNDLVNTDPQKELNINLGADFLTWSARAKKGDRFNILAVEKARLHANTPARIFNDAKGSTLLTEENGGDFVLKTKSITDINGNVLQMIDAMGRVAIDTVYDMAGRVIKNWSIDSGTEYSFLDALGRPYTLWQNNRPAMKYTYDAISRATELHLGKKLILKTIYGETQLDAISKNLRGQPFQIQDQSGESTFIKYDFKGNCLEKAQRLAKTYTSAIDWAGDVTLEDENHITETSYDGLNRYLTINYSEGYQLAYTYSDSGLSSISGDEGHIYISAVHFDAKGRMSMIKYGNGSFIINKYDPLTSAIDKKLIYKGNEILQELRYIYDAQGNVVFARKESTRDIFFKNKKVEAMNEYTYDAIYRLIRATGREHIGQTSGIPDKTSSKPSRNISAADEQSFVNYTEIYGYDLVGNVVQVVHTFDDENFPNWKKEFTYLNNRLVSSTVGKQPGNYNYQYDEHGHLLKCPNIQEMTWNFDGRLVSSVAQRTEEGNVPETTYYTYNQGGNRIRKTAESQSTRTVLTDHRYLDGRDILYKFNGQGNLRMKCHTTQVSVNSQPLILVQRWSGPDAVVKSLPQTLIRYQFMERSQSVSIELDQDGNQISHEEYSPYGQTMFSASVYKKRYRYAFKELDKETGLHYFDQRYYSSWLLTWVSPDPLGIVDGLNTYQYMGCNPTSFFDPTGQVIRTEEEFLQTLVTEGIFTPNCYPELNPIKTMGLFQMSHMIPAWTGKRPSKHVGAGCLSRFGINVDLTCLRIRNDDHTHFYGGRIDRKWENWFKEKKYYNAEYKYCLDMKAQGEQGEADRIVKNIRDEVWHQAKVFLLETLGEKPVDYNLWDDIGWRINHQNEPDLTVPFQPEKWVGGIHRLDLDNLLGIQRRMETRHAEKLQEQRDMLNPKVPVNLFNIDPLNNNPVNDDVFGDMAFDPFGNLSLSRCNSLLNLFCVNSTNNNMIEMERGAFQLDFTDLLGNGTQQQDNGIQNWNLR